MLVCFASVLHLHVYVYVCKICKAVDTSLFCCMCVCECVVYQYVVNVLRCMCDLLSLITGRA